MANRFVIIIALLFPGSLTRAEDAISFETHVQPIFREHCLGCHNADKRKGGLVLDSYAAAMEGGSSGEVLFEGDADSSRLWQLVNHDDSPEMPPNKDPIAEAQRLLVKRWINDGLAERAGKAKSKPKKSALTFAPAADNGSLGAMPNDLITQPVVVTQRAAAIATLAVSPRAPLLAVGGQQQVALYHTDNAELMGVIPFPEGNPHVVRFSRDGSLLLVAGGRGAQLGTVGLHDVITGRRLIRIGDELDVVLAADIDLSLGYVALGGPSKLVKIFDARTGEQLFQMKKHTDWVMATEFSPDGKLLASADRAGGLILWEADTGREYQVCEGHKQSITGISWRSDSKVFATSSEAGNIRLWDPDKVKPIKNWGHGGGVAAVKFAKDGSLVSAGRDRRAKHWDGGGKQLRAFELMPDIATAVAISRDSQQVFCGDWSGQVWGFAADKEAHAMDLAANPPSIETRMAAIQSIVTAANESLAAARSEWDARQAAVQAARNQYAASVQRLHDAEQQARAASRRIYELTELMENDAGGERQSKKELAATKHNWQDHLKATVTAYNNIVSRLADIETAKRNLNQFTVSLATAEKNVIGPRTRLERLAAELKRSE